MIAKTLAVLMLALPLESLAETISEVRHSPNNGGFRIVLDWSDQVPNYELESGAGGSVLWLKTVTRISAPFPEKIYGWTGTAGYDSGLYRITFPASDGRVSVFSLARSAEKGPRLVIDVTKDDVSKIPVTNDRLVVPLKRSVSVSDAAIVEMSSIKEMEQFLAQVERLVSTGDLTRSEGHRLAKEKLGLMLDRFTRELELNP